MCFVVRWIIQKKHLERAQENDCPPHRKSELLRREQERVKLSDKADKEKYRIADEALDREKRQIEEAD